MKRLWMLAVLSLPALAAGRDTGARQIVLETRIVEVGPGILSANFGTNLGNLYANLPSDLAPGDRISGTFATAPKGKTEPERATHAAALRLLTIEMCGSSFPVEVGLFVCPRVSEDRLHVVLKLEMRELGSLDLEVPKAATLPDRSTFVLPTEGLVFNRALVLGPFDGDLTKTSVTIGGTAAHLVAESPRGSIFDVPKEPLGKTRIEFRKGTASQSGTFRSVGLRLTPPRPIIHTGDSTSFSAEVTGLAGLERPLRLTLKNLSTDVVSMEGGDEQGVTIAPGDVSAAGTFAITRALGGRHRGEYAINVSIPWSAGDFKP